jgi:hypothetical protein
MGLAVAAIAFPAAGAVFGQGTAPKVEFNRDIRPILSDNCFTCHGPDNHLRKADLRLDRSDDLYKEFGGRRIITPGQPGKSELYRRLTARDPAEQMPPKKATKRPTKEQIELIRHWIEQGGEYQKHWSLIAVRRPPLPAVKNTGWGRNPIDRFILARLEKEGLKTSPEADRRILIRRLYLDLTGLPPTPAEVDAFVADTAPRAYENLVERLLQSPRFGERLAVYWLDVVRYGDTGGYHSDNHRDLWLYRDYVINAFNRNKPFDQFVTEQLAGDLLPGATDEQKIASGFNRLLQTTEEGGGQAKEYTAKYAADRVRNTGSIFLGVTLGCCECHDHKFDPFTTREFYQFEAFFADINEVAVGRQPQTAFPSPAQKTRLNELTVQIQKTQSALQEEMKKAQPEFVKWQESAQLQGFKGLPGNITTIVNLPPAKRNPQQQQALADYYQGTTPPLKMLRDQKMKLDQEKTALSNAIPTTLISQSVPPRTIRILKRGNWLDDKGEIVGPGIPQAIVPLKVQKPRPDRLDLAKWMTAPENPLTARVFVNRLWMLYFAQGIVTTQYDFGSQGAWPTHPELLDWLAVEFRESGWDVHHLIRLMVTSSTYRQSSKLTEELKKHDPYNHLLARQAAFRVDAEFVRDNALAISGLLSPKIGGPSVKPYQPAGYWKYLNFPTRDWVADKGPDEYRRGLYTYWQRTFLHPSLLAFDAPTREECTAERPRSNTPQQALVLLNDPTYVEAARAFGEKILRQGGNDVESRLHYAFRHALGRKAAPGEVKVLAPLFQKHLQQYQADPKAAQALLHVGYQPTSADLPAPELAAWTSVARVILNLHETITRE